MPYIPQPKREYWDPQLLFDEKDPDLTHPGTLNYIFTRIIQKFVESRGGKWNDDNLDSVYGALLCCLLEVDRRKGVYPEKIKPPPKSPSYTEYNDFLGSNLRRDLGRMKEAKSGVEGCSLDINFAGAWRYYHKEVAPYEDKKIQENGDVYA